MKTLAYATISKYITVNNSIGMIAVGALCWAVYLSQVNIMTHLWGINHFVAEASGIPISWVINYVLNTRYVFKQPMTWKQFGSLCLVSAIGWIPYLGTTAIFTDGFSLNPTIGTLVGVAAKYVWNVLAQQVVTFGILAKYKP